MSNRQQRRASLSEFKRETRAAHLLTYMVPADASLDHEPLLRDAVQFWRSNIQRRRPICIGCKAKFAHGHSPGAFLLAAPSVAPTTASVSALCTDCWRDLSDDEVEAIALRVLRKIMPGASFHPEDRR